MFKRPQSGSTTPSAEEVNTLLGGGSRFECVTFTREETEHLRKLYGYVEEKDKLSQAGADCNMFRHAEHDGLRVIAWLAKYVEPGQDPLKEIVKMAVDRRYDVNPSDVIWAEEEEEEEEN